MFAPFVAHSMTKTSFAYGLKQMLYSSFLGALKQGFTVRLCRQTIKSEISAIRETSERLEVKSLLERLDNSCECNLGKARHRTEGLIDMGFGIADAAHVAFAEQLAEVFITCDDKLLKLCRQTSLCIVEANPLEFIAKE